MRNIRSGDLLTADLAFVLNTRPAVTLSTHRVRTLLFLASQRHCNRVSSCLMMCWLHLLPSPLLNGFHQSANARLISVPHLHFVLLLSISCLLPGNYSLIDSSWSSTHSIDNQLKPKLVAHRSALQLLSQRTVLTSKVHLPAECDWVVLMCPWCKFGPTEGRSWIFKSFKSSHDGNRFRPSTWIYGFVSWCENQSCIILPSIFAKPNLTLPNLT